MPVLGPIEHKGSEPVASFERHGRPRRLFWVWAGPNSGVICLAFGMYVLALGLNWVEAIVAAAVGSALSFLLAGFTGLAGQRAGVPTMIAGRRAFGYHGNKLPALLSYLSLVGWEGISVILGTQATEAVTARLNRHVPTTPVVAAGFAVIIVVTTVVGIYGYDLVLRTQKWITLTANAVTTCYLILIIPRLSITICGHGSVGAFAGGMALAATALGLTGVNMASDYTRYLPSNTRARSILGWTTSGGSLPTIVLMTFGVLMATGNPAITHIAASNPMAALLTRVPTWFLVPFLIPNVLCTIAGCIFGTYSSGLALQALGVRLSRPTTVLVDTVLVILGAGYVVFAAPDFFAPFQAFLTLMGVPLAAWTGIYLADGWQHRTTGYDIPALYRSDGPYRRVNPAGVGCMIIATVIGFGLVTSPDPRIGPLLGFLLTSAARTGGLGSSNSGILVAGFLAAAGYLLLHRAHRSPTATLTTPSETSAKMRRTPGRFRRSPSIVPRNGS